MKNAQGTKTWDKIQPQGHVYRQYSMILKFNLIFHLTFNDKNHIDTFRILRRFKRILTLSLHERIQT